LGTLYDLLKIMIERNASDLHVSTGTPPRIRVDGKLTPLTNEALAPAETKALCYSILTDTQKHKFEENNELDLSFGSPQSDMKIRALIYFLSKEQKMLKFKH